MSGETKWKFLKEKIKEYLQEEASRNPYFKEKLENKDKNIDDCLKYIFSQVQKEKKECVHSSEFYRMASDYYNDEIDMKKVKATNPTTAKLVCETSEEDEQYNSCLTEEEKESIKDKVRKEFEKQEMEKLKAKQEKEKKKIEEKKAKLKKEEEESGQMSLFDWED